MFDDPANAGMVYQLRETIGQLGGWNRMDPVYYALHNGSKETRYNMARVLSEYGDEKVLKHLISALKKKEVDIIAVCKALESWAISLHDRDSASAVLADCLLDEDPWIRSAAAMTLGTAGNLHSAKALINATRSNPEDEYLHYYAGESLAKIFEEYENDALKSELDALLTDNMFLGKEGILRVLNPEEFEHEGKYSKPDADSSAMSDRPDRVKQPAPENKGELEYSFAELGWEETHMVQPASGTFEELIEMLVSENPEVQLSALHALRKLGDLRITATFNKLLPKLTTFYHHEMAEVMGQLQDPRALPVLPEVFPMAWADLKMAIIRSLNRIGGRGAQKTLVIALNDKLPKVRYLAAWALGERISPASLNALKQALTAEKYNYVRKQIEASIENYKGLKTTENPTV